MKQFLYLIFILMAFTSCKEVYEAPPQALLEVNILNSTTSKAMTSKITVLGTGRDSLWIKETSLSNFTLPLSTGDTTSFLISFDSTVEKISIVHSTTQSYGSMETGIYYEFKLKSVEFTKNRIASVQIIDSLVTKNWHENIDLYIRPLPVSGK